MTRVLLYGVDGKAIATVDDEHTMAEILSRHAASASDDPKKVVERAANLITVGLMLCESLRVQGIVIGEQGDDVRKAVMSSAFDHAMNLGPAWRCDGCGCTALSPCEVLTRDGVVPCGWAGPHVCTACAGDGAH